jgi:hypothetical protein
MPRPKGFKLSEEQKAKMQAGRKKSLVKAKANMIEGQEEKVKKIKEEVSIIGYFMDTGDLHPYPVFTSEAKEYKGRMFKTREEAIAKRRLKPLM